MLQLYQSAKIDTEMAPQYETRMAQMAWSQYNEAPCLHSAEYFATEYDCYFAGAAAAAGACADTNSHQIGPRAARVPPRQPPLAQASTDIPILKLTAIEIMTVHCIFC